jgi:hypothetical protein
MMSAAAAAAAVVVNDAVVTSASRRLFDLPLAFIGDFHFGPAAAVDA